ncbi:molybdenum cofactor guanylyltransferase [Enterococcus sp. AZ170]|uniref:molybdenum cofactor guanylyltransferase n=1 Tax=Enterococcus sp. AZ170 TaxID=2774747 RepID=UPI003D2FD229
MCGGKSSRMGFDKALLQLDGEFMLLKTIKQLKKIFSHTMFVTDRRAKFPAIFSQVYMLEDQYPEKGPLGGLVTALENIETDHLFLLACDIPNLHSELIWKMAKDIQAYDIVICKQDYRFEPLYAFYHRSCQPIFQQQLKTNDWRIRKEFRQFSVKVMTLESSFELKNVNTPKELILWNQ